MTNQEILEKALEKAEEGGWHEAHDFTVLNGHIYDLDNQRTDVLIFWHHFAKALWGESPIAFNADQHPYIDENGEESTLTAWHSSLPAYQYHLQQMVIADDPVQYLGDSLPEVEPHKDAWMQNGLEL